MKIFLFTKASWDREALTPHVSLKRFYPLKRGLMERHESSAFASSGGTKKIVLFNISVEGNFSANGLGSLLVLLV